MILHLRNSRIVKALSLLMVFVFLITLNPTGSYALTGGPAQPEFNSFTPIGTSDMVDLASGDFSYNIPLMDVGGFPINLAYNSGVTMDQEASWVGLGWDLSIGQINRQMRGLPDDFDGDEVLYENNIKDNWTVGATFQGSPELFGLDLLNANVGISGKYNSYAGYSFTPSAGISFEIAGAASIGVKAESSPDGLVLSPSLSLSQNKEMKDKSNKTVKGTIGVAFNSRQGLSSVNLSSSVSRSNVNPDKQRKISIGPLGSSLSFVQNTYTPTVQANMMNIHNTANFAIDGTFFGVKIEAEQTGFASIQFIANKSDLRPVYGYDYTERAPEKAVLDFNREKDGVFTKNSANLPLTNYTYDIYSVQGQGVSGMFHPYRSQVGYVYDDKMVSNSTGGSGGAEIGSGWTVDVGIDVEANYTRNRAGIWKNNNDVLSTGVFDEDADEKPDYEEVYYKNVGDLSVDMESDIYSEGTRLGGYDPITLKYSGLPYFRKLDPNYLIKDGISYHDYSINEDDIKRSQRVKRNQTILKVSAKEAGSLGPDFIRHSASIGKDHHTAGFIITRNDGARYNYGRALYNTQKKEVTFAVGAAIGGATPTGLSDLGNTYTGLVDYVVDEDNTLKNKKGDHYFNAITTPAYGHTFLLTSLVSTDYSDTDGEAGPSAGDLGSYTKFQYRDMGLYKWRVPFEQGQASFNEGLKTDPTDDKASYVYGEKETSYIQKIETKTHVALFYISPRKDGYGVGGEDGGIGVGSIMYQLDRVVLYSRGEFYAAGITTAEGEHGNIVFTSPTVPTPIKTVHFVYDYELCTGVPNNIDNYDGPTLLPESERTAGKLTLKKVYFTYRNSNMGQYAAYDFTYNDIDHNGEISEDEENKRNPSYNLKGYDIWGCYKENNFAEAGDGNAPLTPLSAPEFNYVQQNTSEDKALADHNAAAWSITDINLPSGGKIQIDYEADDYQYVQDKKAMRMFKLAGAGKSNNPNIPLDNDFLFEPSIDSELEIQENKEAILFKGLNSEAEFLYFELDENDQSGISSEDYWIKYLQPIYRDQKGLLQFRMFMNMTPLGGINGNAWKNDNPFDYVSGYCELADMMNAVPFYWEDTEKWYGSIPLKKVKIEGGVAGGADKVNPISKAGWQFARRFLGNYVYGMPALEDGTPAGAAMEAIYTAFENMAESIGGANAVLRTKQIARRFIPEKSWVRLSEPTTHKKGGGCRVKQIAMTDEWAAMNGIDEPTTEENRLYNQKYGQEYTYELEDGGSSGVAAYEPVGSKENPIVQPVFVNVNRLLAPDDENYTEEPFGESFFPNPQVTYSRVSVKNLERVDNVLERNVTKHATGHVVTEFFTSKDYPTITDQTKAFLDEDYNPLISGLFSVNVVKHLTLSQGYVVHVNDMNGKMKAQWVYAEDQVKPISGVEYIYDYTDPETPSPSLGNKGRINNTVWAMEPNGDVFSRDIGVEYNIVNDFREMKSTTQVAGLDFQTNTFVIGPITLVVPTPFPKYSRHVTKVNLATTTKVINTFGVLRETIAHDAGAKVSTRNKVWDSETGEVLITETINEYDDHYYSFNFPAHWYYKGMGQAAFNSGLEMNIDNSADPEYNFKTFAEDGNAKKYLHLGDEVLISSTYESGGETYIETKYAWVTGVSAEGLDFYLMNNEGEALEIITGDLRLRVIRSGRRNLQSTSMASIVMQRDPFALLTAEDDHFVFNSDKLEVEDTEDGDHANHWRKKRIVNAGAVEFKDNWDLQCECGTVPTDGAYPGADAYNPYRFNTLGVWRAYKSYLYLTGRHQNTENPDPRMDGFYTSFFSFYSNATGVWEIPSSSYDNWTFTSEVTQYSPYGFELENADALARYSAAQYGYNFSFPLAVAANSKYAEMGFDGFEDYNFDGCPDNEHFGFRGNTPGDPLDMKDAGITNAKSHTGRFSLKVKAGEDVITIFKYGCDEN